MAKNTFLNLKKEKRETFLNAFFREFTMRKYDDASISRVLKELGLAKGSFYQYFENKLDLFIYLQQICGQSKQGHLQDVHRNDFNSFWDYWRALYKGELNFDREHPLKSNFAYSLSQNIDSPSLKEMAAIFNRQTVHGMTILIQPEIDNGKFRKDIPAEKLAFYLVKTSEQMTDYMHMMTRESFETNVAEGKAIFIHENEQLHLKVIEDYILLLSSAMNARH
jgi:AcrR family transcriptional regulator